MKTFYLFLIIINNIYGLATTKQTIIPRCLLRCKDAHMVKLSLIKN